MRRPNIYERKQSPPEVRMGGERREFIALATPQNNIFFLRTVPGMVELLLAYNSTK